jgi:hypothetical protein
MAINICIPDGNKALDRAYDLASKAESKKDKNEPK